MMETRINRCLERCRAEKRGALVVYVTVGCPSPAESEALIGRLIEAGADGVIDRKIDDEIARLGHGIQLLQPSVA